jgi:primary-amine oxidase
LCKCLDILPVVDLNAEVLVTIEGRDRQPVPDIPAASINYHRNKIASNSYLSRVFRSDRLAALNVVQPDGPSFDVTGNCLTWQKWSLHVGFNYREGLVLSNVKYDGRDVLARMSLVEMAVPYADTHDNFTRKCAFDVGSYGLGYCANSLSLGCDCLGQIKYFDAVMAKSDGTPYTVEKAVCIHEEDNGILWKHVEYRTCYNESRRSRRLVLSSLHTVVNYEYLIYTYLYQDGRIDYEIRLTGELSTNLPSVGEESPQYGVMVAPGVNAQAHQHNFCVRIDMTVDGPINTVSEISVVTHATGPKNPLGNGFGVETTKLTRESEAQRENAPARSWRISNASGATNNANGVATAYKLVPGTIGSSQPLLLTGDTSAVTARAAFATRSLWVTPHSDDERYPAGEYPTQALGEEREGLPKWTAQNRNIESTDVVLWHSFGVFHLPSVENFPVMNTEHTGFSLKPDGFFDGNPAIDLVPEVNAASKTN